MQSTTSVALFLSGVIFDLEEGSRLLPLNYMTAHGGVRCPAYGLRGRNRVIDIFPKLFRKPTALGSCPPH